MWAILTNPFNKQMIFLVGGGDHYRSREISKTLTCSSCYPRPPLQQASLGNPPEEQVGQQSKQESFRSSLFLLCSIPNPPVSSPALQQTNCVASPHSLSPFPGYSEDPDTTPCFSPSWWALSPLQPITIPKCQLPIPKTHFTHKPQWHDPRRIPEDTATMTT